MSNVYILTFAMLFAQTNITTSPSQDYILAQGINYNPRIGSNEPLVMYVNEEGRVFIACNSAGQGILYEVVDNAIQPIDNANNICPASMYAYSDTIMWSNYNGVNMEWDAAYKGFRDLGIDVTRMRVNKSMAEIVGKEIIQVKAPEPVSKKSGMDYLLQWRTWDVDKVISARDKQLIVLGRQGMPYPHLGGFLSGHFPEHTLLYIGEKKYDEDIVYHVSAPLKYGPYCSVVWDVASDDKILAMWFNKNKLYLAVYDSKDKWRKVSVLNTDNEYNFEYYMSSHNDANDIVWRADNWDNVNIHPRLRFVQYQDGVFNKQHDIGLDCISNGTKICHMGRDKNGQLLVSLAQMKSPHLSLLRKNDNDEWEALLDISENTTLKRYPYMTFACDNNNTINVLYIMPGENGNTLRMRYVK